MVCYLSAVRDFGGAMRRIIVSKTPTVEDILLINNGVGPGFDSVRLFLAVWVFTLHAMLTCMKPAAAMEFAADPLHRIIISPVLLMFFAVSGYLVTGSAIRTKSVSIFLLFRAFRIAPALIMEVTLSVMILGPWLTEMTLAEYFRDPLFFRYFLNVLGGVQFYLPGLLHKIQYLAL
jgi:peptidoglycan/LPS O-acetylase OafA/YrhL